MSCFRHQTQKDMKMSAEIDKAWKYFQEVDSAMEQIEKAIENKDPIPNWVPLELELTFRRGYLFGKGIIQVKNEK
jgi:hypothetical protein